MILRGNLVREALKFFFVKVSPGLLCVGILHGHDAPPLPVGAVNSEAHWGDPDDGAVSQDDRVVV